MDLKSLLPNTSDTKDVVVSLLGAGAAYYLAQKYLGRGKTPLYSQKPWHALAAAVGGLSIGHVGYTEYQKHEQAKVAGYFGA